MHLIRASTENLKITRYNSVKYINAHLLTLLDQLNHIVWSVLKYPESNIAGMCSMGKLSDDSDSDVLPHHFPSILS